MARLYELWGVIFINLMSVLHLILNRYNKHGYDTILKTSGTSGFWTYALKLLSVCLNQSYK